MFGLGFGYVFILLVFSLWWEILVLYGLLFLWIGCGILLLIGENIVVVVFCYWFVVLIGVILIVWVIFWLV